MTSTARTFVLVPGAGFGAWAWYPVAQRLRAADHRAVALTMPGQAYDGDRATGVGIQDAVAYVVGEVERLDLRDVVLVGHSWGGYPVTGAAHQLKDRVVRVVYCSAVVPQRGVAMADENEQVGAAMRAAIEQTPDNTVPTPPEVIAGLYMQDAPELAPLVANMMLPQPSRYVLEALDVPPVTEVGIPASYVLGQDDIALARPGAEFAARVGVEPVMVPGGHLALLTRPDEVAQALLDLV